jgi:hypothetical protein
VFSKKLIWRKPIMSDDLKLTQNSTDEQISVDSKTFQEFKVVMENEVLTTNARRKFLQTLFLGGVGVGIVAVTPNSLGQVCFPEDETPYCGEQENPTCHPENQSSDCEDNQICPAIPNGVVEPCPDSEYECGVCNIECQSGLEGCVDCMQGPCPPPYGIV